jgi:hypothetical protein
MYDAIQLIYLLDSRLYVYCMMVEAIKVQSS